MVSNSDDSRSDDRENLPLEMTIALQSFSNELAYITECLQSLRELHQLVSTCAFFLLENGMSHKLSISHIHLLLDIYLSRSEYFWDEIQGTVAQLQRTVEKLTGTAI